MPALPFNMVARISAQVPKFLLRLPVASAQTKQLAQSPTVRSFGIRRGRYTAFAPAYSQSRANATMESVITTPLFLITSMQPLCFHVLAHSFASALSCAFFPSWSARARQLFCLHRLGASLSSLRALFCTRFLCFQSLAASFPETPGVGVSVKSPGSSIATWTRRAHPTIIAASSRVPGPWTKPLN